jgi:hypothetical protein
MHEKATSFEVAFLFISIFKLFDCRYCTVGLCFRSAPNQSSLGSSSQYKEAAPKEAASVFERSKNYPLNTNRA